MFLFQKIGFPFKVLLFLCQINAVKMWLRWPRRPERETWAPFTQLSIWLRCWSLAWTVTCPLMHTSWPRGVCVSLWPECLMGRMCWCQNLAPKRSSFRCAEGGGGYIPRYREWLFSGVTPCSAHRHWFAAVLSPSTVGWFLHPSEEWWVCFFTRGCTSVCAKQKQTWPKSRRTFEWWRKNVAISKVEKHLVRCHRVSSECKNNVET